MLRTTLFATALAAAGAASANDAAQLDAALGAVRAGRFAEAEAAASRARDDVVAEIVTWSRALEGQADWEEMARLVAARPEWPRMGAVRSEAERRMPRGMNPRTVLGFFDGQPPRTGSGAMRLAEAQAASGDRGAARATLERAWRELPMTADERQSFAANHPDVTARLATARLDAMLWRGSEADARHAMGHVDAGWRALAEARMGLRERRAGIDGLVGRVPPELQNDPGLAYERFVWRARGDRDAEAEQLLAQRTGSAASLGRPDMWADRRAGIARRAMREGRPAEAYRFASLHHLDASAGTDFTDLEWLSGWIALRGMKDPRRAVGHFQKVWDAGVSPITKGRAGYWLGRAHEAAGDKEAARKWYAEGARHPTSFYGQLAAEKAGVQTADALAATGPAVDWRTSALGKGDTARAIRLLQQAGRDEDARAFVQALANSLSDPKDFAALGRMAMDIGRPDAAVRVGKAAASKGVIVMDTYYPVTELARQPGAVEPAFAKAIARQESELNPGAVSPAGARGLMQLMPATAQKVARDLGMRYDMGALTADPAYNARLGKTYLAEMMARFGGARILAAAAYNAGPGRVNEWLGRFGDPRLPGTDPIDWIESIPFTETRNYVHRVLEGLHVYRARLGTPTKGTFSAALTKANG
jgi:soluble lytic murein transglycosylase